MNISTGIGSQIDGERRGMRTIDRLFSDSVEQETRRVPLAPGVPLRALAQGSVCSLNERGEAQPFDPGKPFCGFVIKLLDDGVAKAAIYARGAVVLRVEGLEASSLGRPIHALEPNRFGLDGGAEVGQIIAIENLERGLAVVAFKRADDPRPFGESGKLVERF